eukprot:TRINITY_DN33327_c0_g1_i1.p1 TRINITY_DN33327_c0_g1~~TRINITY_DN33327_c0_g1_i1.p1  ORF type:complete len:103 (-),score=24.46 TRINITY_DN33327_c0_g1_i1:85-393(-)
MSTPYERAKAGKLTFKGEKAIDKKRKKRKQKKSVHSETEGALAEELQVDNDKPSGIDPTSKKVYEELFPFEAKKFGYADKNFNSAEEALDERVKKKADRYCK